MSLVIALRAGPGMGVACADRRITYTEPSERVFEHKGRKIVNLGGPYFVGVVGDIDLGERVVYETLHRISGRNLPFRQVVDELTETYNTIRDAIIWNHTESLLGVKRSAYEGGKLPALLTESVKDIRRGEHDKPKLFDPDLLIFGIEEGGIGEKYDFNIVIYRAPGVITYPRYSDSIGSGSDMADPVTSDFLESVPARDPYMGFEKPYQTLAACTRVVMNAKRRAAKRNPGVGERSQLVWIGENKTPHETSERETGYLAAALDFAELGEISPEELQRIFEEIVGKPQNKDQRTNATDQVREDLLKSGISLDLLEYVVRRYS